MRRVRWIRDPRREVFVMKLLGSGWNETDGVTIDNCSQKHSMFRSI